MEGNQLISLPKPSEVANSFAFFHRLLFHLESSVAANAVEFQSRLPGYMSRRTVRPGVPRHSVFSRRTIVRQTGMAPALLMARRACGDLRA